MDRASDSGSEGWGFESLPVYHEKTTVLIENRGLFSYIRLRRVILAAPVIFASQVILGFAQFWRRI